MLLAFLILAAVIQIPLALVTLRERQDPWQALLVATLPLAGVVLFAALFAADLRRRMPSSAPRMELDLARCRVAVADSDSVQNRLVLALACLRHGLDEEAVELLTSVNRGAFEDDPLILLGLARAYFGVERFRESRDTLDHLIAVHPDFRSEGGHLLYARSLESLGETERALREYEMLTSYSRTPEAHCRHALLLTCVGRPGDALALYRRLLEAARRGPRQFALHHHAWIALAEREVAALGG